MNAQVVAAYSEGRYADALTLAKDTLETAEKTLGPEHPQTLTSMNNLASLYEHTGRYGDAEPLYRRALEVRERVLGPEHPDTLTSMNNLASLYQSTGRYGDAEPLYRRPLEVRERVLGPEHPDTLFSMNNLALLYQNIGRYGDAEPLYRRALEGSERVLGSEHTQTLGIMNNLALLYQSTARYGDAEPLYRRALKVSERVLGPEHPQTLFSVNNLASLYQSTGRYGDAEPLHRRALEVRERVLGPEHPDTLFSMNNLALLYQSTGRYGDAEPLYRSALEVRERVLGSEHTQTLGSVNNLALLYQRTGRYGAAEPLFRRALEVSESMLGPEHPQTLTSANNLAFLYQSTGRYGDAEPLLRRALESSERVLGSEHPDTLRSLSNLAVLLANSDRPDEAMRALRQIDQRLDQWLRIEVSNARSAAMRRELLNLNSNYQGASFSFVLQNPSPAGHRFAADLTLKWKKRVAQEDAVLNNLVRETDDGAVLELIDRVKAGRAELSRIAFDPEISAEDKIAKRETLEAAEAELRAASEKFRRFQRVSGASADDVSLALPRSSALIEYKLYDPFDFKTGEFGETRLLAVVLRPDADPALVDLGEAGVFFSSQALTVNRVLRAENEVSFDAVMLHGFNSLITPLTDHLDGVETLYVSPDGPLGALPFEAFLTETGTRLIERFDVHTLQTGRDLVARDRPATGKGLVAFGGIDFETASLTAPLVDKTEFRDALDATRQQISSFPFLDESAREVRYIGELYGALRTEEPTPQIFTGLDATESTLKSLQSPPRVLHLATHGYYLQSGSIDGRPLLQSGVTFAGANNALAGKLGADGENGILHALEAQTLNLFGTELVVLSACETGQGAMDYSEGLEGLPRAFYVAGAQNVLAALWPVGDRSAKEFMQRFYDNWLEQTATSDPAAALRKTKLQYLTSTDDQERNPDNWAPFVLFEG